MRVLRLLTNRAVLQRLFGSILLAGSMQTVAYAQPTRVEVITLKHRTAEQMIPVLKPLLDKSGSLSGMQNQLIVRTTPVNLADLKSVLASLDAAPRRLMITVRHDAMLERDRSGADLSGRFASGDNSVSIQTGGAARNGADIQRGDSALRGRIDSTRSLDADRNTQTLQVLEGSSAFIRTGQSVPVTQRQSTRTIVNGQVVDRINSGTEYRDVMIGFYVLPRLAGDSVTLEINPQRDTLARPEQNLPRGSINIQQASTTVSGRLGEWIEIGGVMQGSTSEQTTLLGSTREVSGDNRRILLKVDELR